MAGRSGPLGGFLGTLRFVVKEGVTGSPAYLSMLTGLLLIAAYGLYLWVFVQHAPVLLGAESGGLVFTGMSDHVLWGLYISFFIFWVGVAAAGIMFGIGAYVFRSPGFTRIAVLGEAMAIIALVIVILLLVVDLGRPIRALFLLPRLPNLRSMLDWDFVVLTGYLVINAVGYLYTVHNYRQDRGLPERFVVPFIVVAAPFAISIHTVTAFISQALVARPAWHSPLLAPRYVATAFASGPALLLIALYIAERCVRGFRVDFEVYRKTMYVVVGSLIVGLYFTASEMQEVFWYTTEPLKRMQVLALVSGESVWWLGLLFWLWVSVGAAAAISPVVSPSVRGTKEGVVAVSIMAVVAVVAEKTFTIILPAFIPDVLGQVVGYEPTPVEVFITLGVHALGFALFAVLAKAAIKALMIHYGSEPSGHDPGRQARTLTTQPTGSG